MAKFGKFQHDPDTGFYTCRHKLAGKSIEIHIDPSEESVDRDELIKHAESTVDDWPQRHTRLTAVVAQELVANDYLTDAADLKPGDCQPFYLRIYADPDGEISYTVAFNVPSVLDDEDEYVDVEEEITGAWVNVEVCSTE